MELTDNGMDILKISYTDEGLRLGVLPAAHLTRWFVPLYKKRLVNKRRVGRPHTANRPDLCLIPFTNDIF